MPSTGLGQRECALPRRGRSSAWGTAETPPEPRLAGVHSGRPARRDCQGRNPVPASRNGPCPPLPPPDAIRGTLAACLALGKPPLPLHHSCQIHLRAGAEPISGRAGSGAGRAATHSEGGAVNRDAKTESNWLKGDSPRPNRSSCWLPGGRGRVAGGFKGRRWRGSGS